MLAYLKRHHIGLLALFIALGGTSYAAAKLPRNSVGTAQLRKGSVTTAKLSHSVQAKFKQAGKAGPAGPKGDTGAPGAQGPKGDQGVQGLKGDSGPTDAGVGGVNATITPGGLTTQVSSTTVTLDQPGKILVQLSGTFQLTCGGAACTRTLGVTVGNQSIASRTVPGALVLQSVAANTSATNPITTSGILTGVAAGTYTVTAMEKTTGSPAGTANGDLRIVAIALGG